MQKSQNKKAAKVKRVPRLIGRDSKQGKQIKKSATGHRILRNGTNDSSVKHLVPFALKAVEKAVSFLSIQNVLGEDSQFGTEEKQLKVIEDIFPVISCQKGFKKQELKAGDPVSKVLNDLLQAFDDLAQYERWSLQIVDGNYKLKALRMYGAGRSVHIAVDFLAQINRSYTRLHDFIVWALRLVQETNAIPLFHDWCKGEFSGEYYEYLMEREDDFKAEDEEDQLKYYNTLGYYGPKGIPTVYSNLLRGGASVKVFKSELAKFEPSNQYEKWAMPFLKASLELAETKKKMYDYCKNPGGDEEYSDEAKPYDYMQVIWSWADDDLMYQMFNECVDAKAHGYGVAGFCFEAFVNDTGTFTNNKKDSDIDFCDKVEAFFWAGNEMSSKIKNNLHGAPEQSPLPFNKKRKHDKLINIIL